jgi:hypothetical protein
MTEIVAQGHNGTLVFDGAFVTIRRTGMLARTTIGKGEKRIPLTAIQALQWKQPGALINGYIALTLAGGVEKQSRLGSATYDAGRDENAIIVMKKQAAQFEEIRAAIETALAQRFAPAPDASSGPAAEVARLADLRDRGLLTDAEFAAAKARTLGI